MRFDEKKGWLGIETRDADTLQNAFYVVDTQSGNLVLADYKPKAGWWSGLEDIYGGCLYLHRGNNQQYGQHEGIMAVNAVSGQTLWEQPHYSFYGLATDYLLAKESDQDLNEFVYLDYETGTKIPAALTLSEIKAALSHFQAQRQQQSKVPSHYPENNVFFAELQLFMQETINTEAVLAMDYLETGRYFVIGYYQKQPDSKYTYQVAVFSITGALLLQEKLKTDATGIGLDNFFILNDTLILSKNKDSLLGYGF